MGHPLGDFGTNDASEGRTVIYWAQLFHMYQPPTQLPAVLERICEESYRPLLDVLLGRPHARATVNINGILLEMLQDYGHAHLIEKLRELGARGQVEFTGSSKYHAILPLIPPSERKRQIGLNRQSCRHFLKDAYVPRGFFPPEMCYNDSVLPAVQASGHKWVILSGIACPAPWPVDKVYQIQHGKNTLSVFFRDDILSNKISFKQTGPTEFLEHLRHGNGGQENAYVITAMDAETYGHHIQNWEKLFLAEVYDQIQSKGRPHNGIKQATELATQESTLLDNAEFSNSVRPVTISELVDLFPAAEVISPRPSSWSTSAEDMAAGNHFPLWLDKDSEIHHLQWEHLRICFEMVNEAMKSSGREDSKFYADIARALLDRAEHSCQFWWASRRPMWDINLIHVGLTEQWRVIVNAYRAINRSGASGDIKRENYRKLVAARDLRNKIVDRLFVL